MSYWNDPFDYIRTRRTIDSPRINVGQNKEEMILQVALPGYSRSDIDVEVTGGRLNVLAKNNSNTPSYEFITQEFKLADYSQSWTLPKSINTDSVSANYESGILTITMPLARDQREGVRKIELN